MDKNVVRLQDKLWIMKRIIRPLHHPPFLCIIVAAPSVIEFPQLIIRLGLEQDFLLIIIFIAHSRMGSNHLILFQGTKQKPVNTLTYKANNLSFLFFYPQS